jgi:hypothetical protein
LRRLEGKLSVDAGPWQERRNKAIAPYGPAFGGQRPKWVGDTVHQIPLAPLNASIWRRVTPPRPGEGSGREDASGAPQRSVARTSAVLFRPSAMSHCGDGLLRHHL